MKGSDHGNTNRSTSIHSLENKCTRVTRPRTRRAMKICISVRCISNPNSHHAPTRTEIAAATLRVLAVASRYVPATPAANGRASNNGATTCMERSWGTPERSHAMPRLTVTTTTRTAQEMPLAPGRVHRTERNAALGATRKLNSQHPPFTPKEAQSSQNLPNKKMQRTSVAACPTTMAPAMVSRDGQLTEFPLTMALLNLVCPAELERLALTVREVKEPVLDP